LDSKEKERKKEREREREKERERERANERAIGRHAVHIWKRVRSPEIPPLLRSLDANCRYAEALHKRNYCIRESLFWRTARMRARCLADLPRGLRTSATAASPQHESHAGSLIVDTNCSKRDDALPIT